MPFVVMKIKNLRSDIFWGLRGPFYLEKVWLHQQTSASPPATCLARGLGGPVLKRSSAHGLEIIIFHCLNHFIFSLQRILAALRVADLDLVT